jgi:hypothetical protein
VADDRLDRIETKIDHIIDRVGSIDTTLATQHISLTEHMRRTALLEEAIKPLVKHDTMTMGFIKLIVLVATIFTGVEGLLALLSYLKG